MLPKKSRLSSFEIRSLQEGKHQRFKNNCFSLSFKEVDGINSKLAIVVSKKVFHDAVDRNKLKRQLMSCAKPLIENLRDTYWIIVFVSKGIEKLTYQSLCQEFEKTFQEAGLTGSKTL